MFTRLRHRVFQILEEPSSSNRPGVFVQGLLMIIILLNVATMMLSSVDEFTEEYGAIFEGIEVFSVVVFSVEYILRLWAIVQMRRFRHPITGRIRYAMTPMALVDLLSILPFYLPMLIPMNLLFLRVLRLFRLMRLLKIGRYSESLRTLGIVVHERRGELIGAVMILLVLLVLASSMMYHVEHDTQPEAFSNVFAAMWWTVSTLTTMSSGSVAPVTAIGKALSCVIAILGVGLFALPAGILGSGFVARLNSRGHVHRCPHCGKLFDKVTKP
jgi:voltage-gated potassium channel